jgi:hypothetical protein
MARIRATVLQHYGGKCAYCGVAAGMFLTIDHIAGGGKEHRKSMGEPNICKWLYQQSIRGFPTGYQVLCWNCNSAKHIYGEEAVRAAVTLPEFVI